MSFVGKEKRDPNLLGKWREIWKMSKREIKIGLNGLTCENGKNDFCILMGRPMGLGVDFNSPKEIQSNKCIDSSEFEVDTHWKEKLKKTWMYRLIGGWSQYILNKKIYSTLQAMYWLILSWSQYKLWMYWL